MRKQITEHGGVAKKQAGEQAGWLDLEELAQVEVSSEAADYPIENALIPAGAQGSAAFWQAAAPGPATITLRFDTPLSITRVLLHFSESQHERMQEWALAANLADGSRRELLRQGWNFSPGGSTEQREEHALDLKQVSALMLTIDPDPGRNRYPATLSAFRVRGSL